MRAATLIGGMAATVLLAAAAVAQPAFEWIVEPPGAANGRVADISADGRVVAGYRPTNFVESGTRLPGFRWERGLGRTDYQDPAYAVALSATTGMSADGRVVVGEGRAFNSSAQPRVFRSVDNGQIELFNLPSNATRVLSPRANGDGSKIIGIAQIADNNENVTVQRPVLYTSPTTVQELPLPVNGVDSFRAAYDISADGSRIVGYVGDSTRGNRAHAVIWDSNLNATFLPAPADSINSIAYGTSRASNFTVGIVRYAGFREEFARWQGDELITVPLPPRDATTQWSGLQPTHITNDGNIATGTLFYDLPGGGTLSDGFVWTSASGIVLAREYVLGLNVPLPVPSESIISVRDTVIAADGSTLAGRMSYFNDSGTAVSGAFVLTIPSPATAGLIGGFGIALLRRRRHNV
jgi:uncharacterized membrane protein